MRKFNSLFVVMILIISLTMFVLYVANVTGSDNAPNCRGCVDNPPRNPNHPPRPGVPHPGYYPVDGGGTWNPGSWYPIDTSSSSSQSQREREPPCRPSCGECGGNGCEGTCPYSCGANFRSGCSSKRCTYYAASLTATANIPCITELDDSKVITISGQNTYCGDITIKVDLVIMS